jgi:hypothetical protein
MKKLLVFLLEFVLIILANKIIISILLKFLLIIPANY